MATTGSRAEATARLSVAPVEGAAELFTPAFADYLVRLHDEFATRVRALRDRRAEVLTRALTHGIPPTDPPASEARTGNWRVAPVPDELQRPGIEISGPCSITSMFINALNPGPEGERAAGDLDDDEDSGGHRLIDTVRSAHNRLAAVNRELTFVDRERKVLRVLHVGGDGPGAGQRRLPVTAELGAGEHRHNARHGARGFGVDRQDARVGERAAHDLEVEHTSDRKVVDETRLTREQYAILAAQPTGANDGHRPYPPASAPRAPEAASTALTMFW